MTKIRLSKEELISYLKKASYEFRHDGNIIHFSVNKGKDVPDFIELQGEVVSWEDHVVHHIKEQLDKKPLQPFPEEKIPIYGTHYHCKKCGAEMMPIKRQSWDVKKVVKAIHECPRDHELFIEHEYQ